MVKNIKLDHFKRSLYAQEIHSYNSFTIFKIYIDYIDLKDAQKYKISIGSVIQIFKNT